MADNESCQPFVFLREVGVGAEGVRSIAATGRGLRSTERSEARNTPTATEGRRHAQNMIYASVFFLRRVLNISVICFSFKKCISTKADDTNLRISW